MCLLWSESAMPLKVKVFSHAAFRRTAWALGHKLTDKSTGGVMVKWTMEVAETVGGGDIWQGQ